MTFLSRGRDNDISRVDHQRPEATSLFGPFLSLPLDFIVARHFSACNRLFRTVDFGLNV